jgi:hypothetical protein
VLTLFSEIILTVIQAAEAKDIAATLATEIKDTAAILATSQARDKDFEEPPERPTKRPHITHETDVQDLATRSDASRQAVLNTSELLEGILAWLPPKQLFVGQRVCKQWRDAIASSPELQKKMFLRVEEVPRQNWGLKVDYYDEGPSGFFEVRRFDDNPLSWPWREVSPVVLSPHLTADDIDDEAFMGTCDGDYVTFRLPCSVPVGHRISILNTHFSNPPCYDFKIYIDIKFEPPIPGYSRLCADSIGFKTGKALKFGEALDKAMAMCTDVSLYRDCRDDSAETLKFRKITVTEVISKLQREYSCTAILCESSTIFMENVVIPDEQQWAEVDAAYAKTIQRTE